MKFTFPEWCRESMPWSLRDWVEGLPIERRKLGQKVLRLHDLALTLQLIATVIPGLAGWFLHGSIWGLIGVGAAVHGLAAWAITAKIGWNTRRQRAGAEAWEHAEQIQNMRPLLWITLPILLTMALFPVPERLWHMAVCALLIPAGSYGVVTGGCAGIIHALCWGSGKTSRTTRRMQLSSVFQKVTSEAGTS